MEKRERKFITLGTSVLEKAKAESDEKGMSFSAYVSMCITEYWKQQERAEKLTEKLGEQFAERKELDTKALELLQVMMKEMAKANEQIKSSSNPAQV